MITTNNRRYDIDWLRVIAIGFLLIYHIGIGFQPWGVFIQFIQNDQSLEALWVPMSMINVWRIPLLFFVSGMGVCFAMRKRSWKELIMERSKRILLPFVFGVAAIVPLHIWLWKDYYSQDLGYDTHPAHLWFLANIFIYVLILIPLFYYLKKKESTLVKTISQLFTNPVGYLLITGFFVLEAVLVDPQYFTLYAMTMHGFWLGLIAFLFGFTLVYAGDTFWPTALKWRWIFMVSALGLFILRYLNFDLQAPNALMAVESCLWIFALFGFAYKYLNIPSKTLSYLSQAAYPVYIIHMVFLYLASYLLFPLELSALVKFLLVNVITFVGCFVLYEFAIRRISVLRPLFGLKSKSANRIKEHIENSLISTNPIKKAS